MKLRWSQLGAMVAGDTGAAIYCARLYDALVRKKLLPEGSWPGRDAFIILQRKNVFGLVAPLSQANTRKPTCSVTASPSRNWQGIDSQTIDRQGTREIREFQSRACTNQPWCRPRFIGIGRKQSGQHGRRRYSTLHIRGQVALENRQSKACLSCAWLVGKAERQLKRAAQETEF